MKDVGQRAAEVAALKHTMPYVRMFKGKTFVVKVSGSAAASDASARALVEQLEILLQLGIRVVLVHGGGPQATALARQMGVEPRFVHGRRVTDETSLAAAVMALNGEINTRFVAACRALGLPAVGLSGVDSGALRARRRPPVEIDGEMIDYGHVGDLVSVDASVLERVLAGGFLPIVSPISADDDGKLLNVNADTVAAAIAIALGAEKLVLLTGAPGILEQSEDPRTLVPYTDLAGLEALRDAGSLKDGMRPKAEAIAKALREGVRRAHVIPSGTADSLLLEVFTNEGIGTMVVPDIQALLPAERE
jgi:acetylglutamate kinase